MWFKICKSIFYFNEYVFLCCTYMQPRGSKVLNQNNIDLFDIIETGIEKYKVKGKVCLTGDFNCRTANESEFIVYDRFVDANSTSQSYSQTMPRVSKILKNNIKKRAI